MDSVDAQEQLKQEQRNQSVIAAAIAQEDHEKALQKAEHMSELSHALSEQVREFKVKRKLHMLEPKIN